MKPEACQQEELMRWAARGVGSPADDALEQHVASCTHCADQLASITLVRTRLAELPARRIAGERLDAMRFELVAAARGAAATRQPARPPPSRPLRQLQRAPRWLAAVGAVALAAAAAWWMAWPSPHRQQVAQVELIEGASGLSAHEGPDEVYALLRGRAHFRVRALQAGERFRVVAGGDSVEVRGTRFDVEVDDGRITVVEVVEGAVVLSVAEGDSQLLTAGQTWRRPPNVGPTTSGLAAAAQAPEVDDTAETREASRAPRDTEVAASPPESTASSSSSAPRVAPPSTASSPAARGPAAPASAQPVAGADGAHEAAFDARFHRAMQLLKSGAPGEAAKLFDTLGQDASVDDGRRGDALYWAAQAHAKAGRGAEAEQRARALAETRPGSWHADDAALMVGESLLERGDVAGARPWLERAARSPRESVRARAERALRAASR